MKQYSCLTDILVLMIIMKMNCLMVPLNGKCGFNFIRSCMKLKNGQTYYKNLAMWTTQDFKSMFSHFSKLYMKWLIPSRIIAGGFWPSQARWSWDNGRSQHRDDIGSLMNTAKNTVISVISIIEKTSKMIIFLKTLV